jgi:hypothetical protein
LSKTGCEVELGVELQHLEQFDDHVKVSLLKHNLDGAKSVEPIKEEESYDWVIGSDGAKGAVRRELGLKLLGETTTYSFITGDFRLEGLESDVSISSFDSSTYLIFSIRDGTYGATWRSLCKIIIPSCVSIIINTERSFNRISLRPTEIPGVFNFVIGAPNLEEHTELYTGNDAVMDYIRANIGQRAHEITFGEILYLSPGRYVFLKILSHLHNKKPCRLRSRRINVRMAETFRKGRTFLIGGKYNHVPSLVAFVLTKWVSIVKMLDTFTV